MEHAWGYASDKRLREENEDTYGVFRFPTFTLLVVCDGMGGHAGGRQASNLAVRTIWENLGELGGRSPRAALKESIEAANAAIHDASRKSRKLMGMGTTVVAVAIEGDVAHVAHVGDSRCYMLRDGQAVQVTRDHTMVNLFVDAELLSPEDAASHPEAHVLARSLGVEKTVEVEVHDPIPLRRGDAFMLCSDGVHGVVTDWEIAQLDWSDPNETARNILWTVRDRDGDDNATLVTATIGGDPKSSPPPTEPPSGLITKDPGGQPTPLPGGPTPPPLAVPKASIVAKTPTEIPAPAIPAPPRREPAQAQAQATPARPLPKPSRDPASPMKIGLVFAMSGLLSAVVVGGILKMRGGGAPPETTVSAEAPDEPLFEVEAPTIARPKEAAAPPVADAAVEAPPAVEAAPPPALATASQWLFSPQIPPAPLREPHRPQRYLAAPPGGGVQYAAVQAARGKQCATSLDAVEDAMARSVDYASLYPQAWDCFARVHQQVVLNASVSTWQEFTPYRFHFEGAGGEGDGPYWNRAATDGLEFRLQAFMNSGTDDLFAAVMLDHLGPERVADELGTDVLLEAQAASGFAAKGATEPPAVQWWARRLYFAGRAMQGPVGELVKEHRPDLHGQILLHLDQATYGGWSDEALAAGLPPTVRVALHGARTGETLPEGDAPSAKTAALVTTPPIKKKAPPPPPEPPPPPPQRDIGDITVHKGE